jgi:Tfp pilus assembly protein PilO
VKYDTTNQTTATASTGATAGSTPANGTVSATTANNYGTWNLEFSTTGTYNNFLNFMKDLENNLRIVDISSISFSSNASSGVGSVASNIYTYDFKIKTYWLEN